MKKIVIILALVFATSVFSVSESYAQCAMCTVNAEQGAKNGNTQTKGINAGVLYLLAIPFTLIAGIGTLWYFKFRNKPEESLSH